MRQNVSFREAVTSPALLGNAMPGESWRLWRTLGIAAFGEELSDQERELYASVTGRDREPGERVRQFWAPVGRRSGKTRAAATIAAYVGTCCDLEGDLADGERAVIPVLASSKDQAGRAFMNVKGVLEHSPDLRDMIDGEPTANVIRLTTPVDIEIRAANFRTIRGITSPLAICDEIAFWDLEGSANPDKEILAALRPALLTTKGMLWVISSPFGKSGELYRVFKAHHGPEGAPRILVANGPTLTFNPKADPEEIAQEYENDAEVASAEYGGLFREDLVDFVSLEAVEACVIPQVTDRRPEPGKVYHAFADMSGGRGDSAALGIAHAEDGRAVLDLLVERKAPFSPDDVVAEFADLLRGFGLATVAADAYAAEWVVERFRVNGIGFRKSERSRSEIYLNFLPLVNSRRVALLDHPRLVHQLVGLKRRTTRGGRDSVDHATGHHDDVANAAAGAVGLCVLTRPAVFATFATYGNGGILPAGAPAELPLPAWALSPETATAQAAVDAYLSRRSH